MQQRGGFERQERVGIVDAQLARQRQRPLLHAAHVRLQPVVVRIDAGDEGFHHREEQIELRHVGRSILGARGKLKALHVILFASRASGAAI